eukprot:UN00196
MEKKLQSAGQFSIGSTNGFSLQQQESFANSMHENSIKGKKGLGFGKKTQNAPQIVQQRLPPAQTIENSESVKREKKKK